MGAMMGGGMMPNSDAPTSNGFGPGQPGSAGTGPKMAPQKSHFRRGKLLTSTLAGLNICNAGGWSVCRPFICSFYLKTHLTVLI